MKRRLGKNKTSSLNNCESMFTRSEILKRKEYWILKIQLDLYDAIFNYMKKRDINKTQLASKLGCSRC